MGKVDWSGQRVFDKDGPSPRLLHDSQPVRLAVFGLEQGQEIGGHSAPAYVLMIVMEGEGTVQTGDATHQAKAGDAFLCEPNEVHGFSAGESRMTVLAVIAPRPH